MAQRKRAVKGEALDRVIGVQIFRVRQRKGWTIAMLAEKAGVHKNTVQNAENGLRISVRTLWLIAGALGVTASALMPKAQHVVSFPSKAMLFD